MRNILTELFATNHALSQHSKCMYIREKVYKKVTFALCVLQPVVVPVSYVPFSRHLTVSSLPMLVYMTMYIASIIIYHLPKHCNTIVINLALSLTWIDPLLHINEKKRLRLSFTYSAKIIALPFCLHLVDQRHTSACTVHTSLVVHNVFPSLYNVGICFQWMQRWCCNIRKPMACHRILHSARIFCI